jgi:hypothetical protein
MGAVDLRGTVINLKIAALPGNSAAGPLAFALGVIE